MADNPKSLASLADDLEALAKRMQTGLPNRAADLCFRAAAALRAPTIAADRGIGFAFVLVKRFQELSSAAVLGSFEFNERGKAWLQEAFDYAAALSTPSPTIEAQSKSLDALPPFWKEIWSEAKRRNPTYTVYRSEFNDGAHFVIKALREAAEALIRLRKIDDAHDGPWEDQDAFNVFNQQISGAYHATKRRWSEVVGAEVVEAMWQCPADDESPTIAAPSPSNEVTPEMVEAAQRVPLNVSGRTYLRLVIEAALKARKPADD